MIAGIPAKPIGLSSYARSLAQKWDLAEAAFRECLQFQPDDGPSGVFLQRIQALRDNPPGNDWTGVWQLSEK
jgi:adenylate cyclase